MLVNVAHIGIAELLVIWLIAFFASVLRVLQQQYYVEWEKPAARCADLSYNAALNGIQKNT